MPSVADPRVQAALERIADSAGIDLNAMPHVLEDVYRRLNSALADHTSSEQAGETGHASDDVRADEHVEPEPRDFGDGAARPDFSA